ncbi:MAG: RlmE family RNA methyltransferase [Promethearchaeota archaeon]|nr:MAG: RlmE family RNA methyltransferase [Candidatus Lokiarchaeota archaeon]
MSKRWLTEHHSDEFHKKSKQEGYYARSAYKLLNIDEKFNIFKNIRYVLDLGASPGSWLQVTSLKLDKSKTKIMGVDLKKIRPVEGVKQLHMDVYSDQLEEEIRTYFTKGIDLVLSDLAPNTSGNKILDSGRSIALVMRAYDISHPFLRQKGKFVAKLFQCAEMNEIKHRLEKDFLKVQFYKPKASRQHSRELFIIASGFKK